MSEINGTAADDTLHGGYTAGGDTIKGLGGNDSLTDGPGADLMLGGQGDDTLVIEPDHDGDTLNGGSGVDLAIIQTFAIDSAIYGGPYTLDLSDPTIAQTLEDGTTLIGVERVHFSASNGDDDLTGGGFADTLFGFGGDDVLSGGGGEDEIDGSVGDDTLSGGGGNDTLDGGNESDRLAGGGGDDSLDGGAGLDTLNGGNGDDTLSARDNDALNGGAGIDLAWLDKTWLAVDLRLDLSNPAVKQTLADGTTLVNVEQAQVFSGSGNDELIGGDFADVLNGGSGDDTLVGGDGDDAMSGSAGFDVLRGGKGDDVLNGGSQADDLRGGAGADTFWLALTSGHDTVRDFASGVDQLRLSGASFSMDAGTDLAAEARFVASANPVATSSKATFLYDTDSGLLAFDADGNGSGFAVLVAHLVGNPVLSASDFDIV